ncbi:uncharacterized protein LOC131321770 [Rhododendron vialii]|uniref:uncharacterized protein LOC131321770 n=1 Tax=Rhododendron vialii TaxID=182163 RepID=UPI00265DD47F|nr:uncharacterized protein LOC131321770 [Rhododendron vialii]
MGWNHFFSHFLFFSLEISQSKGALSHSLFLFFHILITRVCSFFHRVMDHGGYMFSCACNVPPIQRFQMQDSIRSRIQKRTLWCTIRIVYSKRTSRNSSWKKLGRQERTFLPKKQPIIRRPDPKRES